MTPRAELRIETLFSRQRPLRRQLELECAPALMLGRLEEWCDSRLELSMFSVGAANAQNGATLSFRVVGAGVVSLRALQRHRGRTRLR